MLRRVSFVYLLVTLSGHVGASSSLLTGPAEDQPADAAPDLPLDVPPEPYSFVFRRLRPKACRCWASKAAR